MILQPGVILDNRYELLELLLVVKMLKHAEIFVILIQYRLMMLGIVIVVPVLPAQVEIPVEKHLRQRV